MVVRSGVGSKAMAAGGEKPLRPRQCKGYLQKTLAGEFRKIVLGFVKEAKKGGCAHMKLAAELLEPAGKAQRKGKGSLEKMLDEVGE